MERAVVPSMDREERLRCWIDVYSDAILRTCFLYLSDRAQAEDALQDTWMKAWRYMGEYERKGVQNDKAWLMRIAINTCKDYRRTAWFRHIDNRKAWRPPLTSSRVKWTKWPPSDLAARIFKYCAVRRIPLDSVIMQMAK